MSGFQPKVTRHTKRQKQFQETEQVSEQNSDTEEMLELSNQEFSKKSMINMLKPLVGKMDNIKNRQVM